MIIRLNTRDKQLANEIAYLRYTNSRALGIVNDYTATPIKHLDDEYLGVAGELAVAKYLHVPTSNDIWTPWGNEDVVGYQVRTTGNWFGTLKIRPRSHKDMVTHRDDAYILVVRDQLGMYDLKGWIYGYEGIKEEYLKAPDPKRQPAYCVPIDALHDMTSLPDSRTKAG